MTRIWLGIMFGYILICFTLWELLLAGGFKIWFLDVGQGDAVLIATPSYEYVLIDGGPNDQVINRLSEVLPFWINRIDYLVLTHPHADHVNGLVDVIRKYQISGVILSGAEYHNAAYKTLLEEVSGEVMIVDGNWDFALGEVVFDLIYPDTSLLGVAFENINDSSVVMRVIYGDLSIFLSGDLEDEAVLEGYALLADVMKAGHHGSRTSNSAKLLEAIQPGTVIISSGVDNQFGHPASETLQRFESFGLEIWRTDLQGTIEVSSDGEGYEIRDLKKDLELDPSDFGT